MTGRTLFISDLHLDDSRPGIVEAFEAFLAREVPGADALYILGDLFEYWVGDDGLGLPLPARATAAIAAAGRAVPKFFMHGNRDFLAASRFARAAGLELLDDPTEIDLYGRRALLLHGDTLCTGDVGYQQFRAQVRDPAWQQAALARPLAERVAIAKGLREKSEAAKGGKSMEIMDVTPEAVERAFADSGCELMIHGHTHRPGRHEYVVGGLPRVRWVLGDWYDRASWLEATPAGLRALQA